MDSKQSKIVFAVMIVVLSAGLVSPLLFSKREQPLPLYGGPLSFDAPEGYRMVREFVTQFPNRAFGSLESRQSTGYVQEHLEQLGYSTTYAHFNGRIRGRKQVGRNVLAYKQGGNPEILAVVAHLDTAKTTVQGAADNGSGVGVLLELARVFAGVTAQRSLLFICSDGKEWGSLGARDVAANYPERNRIATVLSLDYAAAGNLAAFRLDETGQLKGFTPPWLRQLARSAAGQEGLPVRGSSGFSEYFERAFLISSSDQGPFLGTGIAAVNLGSESTDRARQREIYHSARDTIENLKLAGFEKYGRAAERIVRTLDALPSIPPQSMDPLRLWNALYLRPWPITALQVISFLPLPVILWFHWKNRGRRMNPALAGREFLAFLGTVLPLWIIYFLIALFRALRQIPVYTFYPALKDPVLQNPPWVILGTILGTAIFAAAVCFLIAYFSFRSLPKPDFHVSKTVLLALLLIGVVYALMYNLYWASLFLVLPAWIWALAGGSGMPASRALNRLLILAAGIAGYAALWIIASRLDAGWNFAWHLTLALSNGLFTQTAYFLATAVIAIGIRFLAIQGQPKSEWLPGSPAGIRK